MESAPSNHNADATVVTGVANPTASIGELREELQADRYEIGSEIARGGMGRILSALEKPLRRKVALKLLLKPVNEEYQRRFIREARITGGLQHPSIAPIHEISIDERGQLFYTMKLVQGLTLHDLLARLRAGDSEMLCQYPLPVLLNIFQKVCDAVAFAHSQPIPIVHRDLKPANIMIGDYGEVLVMDWGAAKLLDGGKEITQNGESQPNLESGDVSYGELLLTQPGSIMGTPGYMAPEQVTGQIGALDQRTDVYALGCILYSLLTLDVPGKVTSREIEELETADDTPARFQERAAPLLGEASLVQSPRLPDSLVAVALKAMSYRRGERYESVKQLQADIAAYQAGRATIAECASTWKQLKLLVVRNKTLFGAIAAIFVILTIATSVSLYERQSAFASNLTLQLTLHRASEADHERARQHFAQEEWRQGVTLLGRALTFSPQNQVAANYLLSALLNGRGDRDRLPLFGMKHRGPVYEADFSPDGARVVTASYDHTCQVWELATGKRVFEEPLQHSGPVNCARFSPDGRKIVTATHNGFAYVWDAQTGHAICKPLKHGKPELDESNVVETAVFSPDGKRILTASWDHTARVWDAETGEQIAELVHPNRVASATFSPDGNRIVASYWYGGAILWDANTFQRVGAPMSHGATVRKVLFTPHGERVITASLDNTARIWDARTGQPLCEPLQHPDQIWNIAVSGDGQLFATACYDKTARLWSKEGLPVGRPMEHEGPVTSVAFSSDGSRLLTASRDKTVRIWDVKTCQPLGRQMRHDDTVFEAIFTPDGAKVLSLGWDDTAYLWNGATQAWPGEAIPLPGRARVVELAGNDDELFAATTDGHAGIWSLAGNQFLSPTVDHGAELATAAIARTKKVFATAGKDNVVRFWETQSGTKLSETPKQGSPVSALAFSDDGSSLFAAYLNGEVFRWNVSDAKLISSKIKHSEMMDAITLSPSGKEIATGCRDTYLHFWDAQTGVPTRPDVRTDDPVLAIAYHPDGEIISAGCADHIVRTWSVETGEQIGAALLLKGPATFVRYIAGSRALLVASTADEQVNCYDPSTGLTLFAALPHNQGIVSATANNDGSKIVTVTAQGVARLWQIPSATLPPPKWLPEYIRAISGLAFSDKQQLEQVSTRERLELRNKLLSQPRENTVWDKVMRESFQLQTGNSPHQTPPSR